MDLEIMEWIVRWRFWLGAGLVVLAVLVYFGKEKSGWQGWRKFVFGNMGAIIGGAMRGVSIAVGFVLKKVPWKPLFIWGPWVVIGLILAFYGVENWRGARLWEQVRSDLEARGETLEVADFMPGPVPDEENFAQHPAVLEELRVESIESPRGGTMAGFSTARSGWSSTPDRGEAVDVTNWLPAADRLSTERESAIRCLELMAPQEESMAGIAAAARLARCDFGLKASGGPVTEAWMNPLLFRMLGWTSAFSTRASLRLRAGDSDGALHDLETCMQLSRQCGKDPLLIAMLVEMAITRGSLVVVWEGLRSHAWSGDERRRIDALLAPVSYPKRAMEVFRTEAAYAAEMTHLLKDQRDAFPMGLDVLDWLTGAHTPSWWDEGVGWAEEGVVYVLPDGWFDLLRADLVTALDRAILQPDGVRGEEVTFGMIQTIDGELAQQDRVVSGVFGQLMLSPYGSTIRRMLHTQTRVDLARVAMALERHRLRAGDYPARLDVLVSAEMPALPVDLVSGDALHYRLKEDGTPLIWSVGSDGEDGGGLPSRDPEKLDWVWQYTVSKGQTENDWRFGQAPGSK